MLPTRCKTNPACPRSRRASMTGRRPAAMGALAAVAFVLLAGVAQGCSDIMLSNPDIFEGAVVSARNVSLA